MAQELQEIWNAPAKVNLYLKVLGKREDGFHELESLMVPLDLSDQLHFKKAEEYQLCCDAEGVPVDETNLITRAVRAFEKHTGKLCSWQITLTKNVPHGAGLGGGSSDAAAALLALNALEGADLPVDVLAAMGAEFGSDVPFFVYERYCTVRGRGEVVEPVEIKGLAGESLLLIKPSFGVSTPDAYKNCMNADAIDGIDYAPQQMPWGEMVNDLEIPVFYKHRFLAETKAWLLAQPEVKAAMMSGSGSTMMVFLHDDKDSELIMQRAKDVLDPSLWTRKVAIL